MHDNVKAKLEELSIRPTLALDDDEASDGGKILRWAAVDDTGEPMTIELYNDGFLDIWYIRPREGERESVYSEWVLI